MRRFKQRRPWFLPRTFDPAMPTWQWPESTDDEWTAEEYAEAAAFEGRCMHREARDGR